MSGDIMGRVSRHVWGQRRACKLKSRCADSAQPPMRLAISGAIVFAFATTLVLVRLAVRFLARPAEVCRRWWEARSQASSPGVKRSSSKESGHPAAQPRTYASARSHFCGASGAGGAREEKENLGLAFLAWKGDG